jgi:two-component system, OmpR family, sensor histidine kinase KdpD
MSTKTADFDSLGAIDGSLAQATFNKSATAHSQFNLASSRSVPSFRLRSSMMARAALGLFAVLLITEFFRHGPSVNATTVGFAYLLAILVASTCVDLRVSVVMCLASTLAYDYYFLPPISTFNINDAQDWVALFAFLVTALIGTRLASGARNRANEATLRRLEVEKLYILSHSLLCAENPSDVLEVIPGRIAASFALESAALYVSEGKKVFCSGIALAPAEIESLQEAASFAEPQIAPHQNVSFAAIRLSGSIFGSIGLYGQAPSREVLKAVAALAAVAIERARGIEQVAKVEATRENERLKSVLLDAITHDFRTPLTSIKVSATGLLDDLEFDREQRKELLTIIDEECDRMNRLVGEASEMARLESGEVKLELGSYSVGELIVAALAECKSVTPTRKICVDANHRHHLRLLVDLSLAKKALVHLVTNAHLYSSPGQPITIETEERGRFLIINVADRGTGIEEAEVSHIFDKFYRGKKQRYRVQGTGMGLPITKAIVETHGGTIGVVSRLGQGSVFTFSLPIE